MRISDIQIDDVLGSTIYEHSIRVLSRPRILEGCWVVDAIHVSGEHIGARANSYHVGEDCNIDVSRMELVSHREFYPIKFLPRLKF
jgi:hypothetical protein